MSISDKTRKILWGKSGNRCAMCRHELSIDRNHNDKESIIGEDRHIISEKEKGPRHDSQYKSDTPISEVTPTLMPSGKSITFNCKLKFFKGCRHFEKLVLER